MERHRAAHRPRTSTLGLGFDAGSNHADAGAAASAGHVLECSSSFLGVYLDLVSATSAVFELTMPTPATCSTKCFHKDTELQKSALVREATLESSYGS